MESPTWDGEVLELIAARRGLLGAALDVARAAVTDVSETDETYREMTKAARRLVAAEDAYATKLRAVKDWPMM